MSKILLILPSGFEILEASAFIDVMGWNMVEGDKSTTLYTCGLHKEVVSSFGQKFIVDYLIDDIDVSMFDALAVPGGFEENNYYGEAYEQRVLQLFNAFHEADKIIASVCVGALVLGKSGILKGKIGTTYPSKKRRETLTSYDVEIVDMPIVKTGNIITSCGPATAIDVSLSLLAMLTSTTNANKVKALMGFGSNPEP